MRKQILLLIFTFLVFSMSAQSSLWGNIWDSESSPVAYANIACVRLDGRAVGATTDLDGYYRIDLAPGVYTVTFSSLGYKDFRVDSLVVGMEGGIKLDAILEENAVDNEVVLISKKYTAKVIGEKDGETFRDESALPVPSPPPPPPRKSTKWIKRRKVAADYISDEVVVEARSVSAKSAPRKLSADKAELALKEIVSDGGSSGATAGTLTAGEVNDFGKWNLWSDKSQRSLTSFRTQWWIYPSKRFSVLVQNQQGFPVVGQKVVLMNSNQEKIWVARTDNLGRAELWANMFDEKHWGDGHFTILAKADGEIYTVKDATLFNDGVNHLIINKLCDVSDVVDVAFVVDATGSMGDEIAYLKAELNDVIARVQEDHETLTIRLGSVFYRDEGEAYLTRKSEFSTDISKTINFIKNQSAAGGGDTPEAVEAALEDAIEHLSWSEHARSKLLFLVLDAPPHTHGDVLQKLNSIIVSAAQKGIRIIPITGSGIDKNTEYLMRCLSLSTNGTYVFLTDHSGVGGSHIKPTTDSYNVETLNDLLVRLFDQFTTVVSCEKVIDKDNLEQVVKMTGLLETDDSSTKFSCKLYPNPTYGQLTIKIKGDVKELFLTDSSGRLLERLDVEGRRKLKVDLSRYPAGIYQVSYWGENDRAVSGRVVLVRD